MVEPRLQNMILKQIRIGMHSKDKLSISKTEQVMSFSVIQYIIFQIFDILKSHSIFEKVVHSFA